MTSNVKVLERDTLEIKSKQPRFGLPSKLVGLALAIKKYFPEAINSLRKVIGNRIRLLERAEMLADATSFQRTAIIMSAVKLGVFDYLHKHPGVPANLVARDLNLNLISTERLFRVLESLGYLKSTQNNKNNDHQVLGYVNTQITKNYLVKESPSYLGDYYNLVSQTWSSWLSLNFTIQTGSSNQEMDLFNGNDETLYEYYAFANEYLKEPSRELFTKIPLDQVNRIITGEVGITFIGKLLERKPDVEFVLAGLENQIDFLEQLLTKYPLPKSPEEIIISPEGNALSDQWGANEEYDIVFLFRKLSYSDYGSQFIKKSFQVLRPKGMVIILEPTTDSLVPSPSFLPELEIMDLLIGGVKAPPLYSTDKIVNLLREVGFMKTEVVSTQKGSFLFVVGWKN
ncbi:methyltransferase dimerization domain-containing protein [Moorena sp. SIO3H5]|uniref:methyltransferase family protein n=1 Tax=Moorena sp. SIO3H5 TaxID=2607834 RepID=UPI0013BB7A81|nr:methyltransferase dimerization domain-containing protein [Moorena sp. SIO3H5]NEO71493.1 hypothetical protein [Moorena sp. SIO3H5]